jgi:predicted RNA-binding Zn-ribbon protein involved in translation (DUF1610 family)
MPKSSSKCRHNARRPFSGMRRVGAEADLIHYECAKCGAVTIARRCSGTTSLGARCSSVARTGFEWCWAHGIRP